MDSKRSILLFGPPNSGKSMYMLSLVYYGDEPHGEEDRRFVVLPKLPYTADFVEDSIADYKKGSWGSTGNIDGHEFRLYSLPARGAAAHLRHRNTDPVRVEGSITCWDIPGQVLERGRLEYDERMKTLAQAQGMIFLISAEPTAEQKSKTYYHHFFYNTVGALIRYYTSLPVDKQAELGWGIRGDHRLPFPVVLCLSKVDRLDAALHHRAYSAGVKDLILDHLGDSSDMLLRYFRPDQTGFYGISSTGKSHAVGDPKPQNVLAPLSWILRSWRKS